MFKLPPSWGIQSSPDVFHYAWWRQHGSWENHSDFTSVRKETVMIYPDLPNVKWFHFHDSTSLGQITINTVTVTLNTSHTNNKVYYTLKYLILTICPYSSCFLLILLLFYSLLIGVIWYYPPIRLLKVSIPVCAATFFYVSVSPLLTFLIFCHIGCFI